jgi:hypothetical protein
MGNFMCGNNEASGGLNFLEGLTYNYIKKADNANMGSADFGKHRKFRFKEAECLKLTFLMCS